MTNPMDLLFKRRKASKALGDIGTVCQCGMRKLQKYAACTAACLHTQRLAAGDCNGTSRERAVARAKGFGR